MADTYEVSKKLWGEGIEKSTGTFQSFEKSTEEENMVDIEKSTGASKGQGDERGKAGDVKEAGEKRADLADTAAIPSENKKDIAPKDGKLAEKANPSGSPDAATKGQGDERDEAGDVKEKGEKRAKLTKAEEEVEKCNEGSPMVAKKKKVAEIVKAWEDDGRIHTFFGFLKKADPELSRELPVTPELWKDYMINHSKNVNKGIATWDETSQELLNKSYADIKKFPKFGKDGKKEEPEKEEKDEK